MLATEVVIQTILVLLTGLGFALEHGPSCIMPSNLLEYTNNQCSGTPADQSYSCFKRDIVVHYDTKAVKLDNGQGCWYGFSDFDGTSCSGTNFGKEFPNYCMKVLQPRPDGSVLKCFRWSESC
ncbi:uncharacterized protein PV09_04431 [Verruconis gallopava]|uniref:Uncharacterized protein n=1 Tax=Verruconis gallopava TaxID=253628 RepID=A0A0D1YVH0_9PEZI|nr:uncharacterized protein PV09_04431 [Verruconis gallopava]KIW04697.1 hypothetical protein PV09_04431 [Verruconis gallopava]